jgi:hypothetical protein
MKSPKMLFSLIKSLFTKTNLGPVTREYPDPVLPSSFRRKRKPRTRLGTPPCTPGTITHFDAVVRVVGRRKADRLYGDYIGRQPVEWPELRLACE